MRNHFRTFVSILRGFLIPGVCAVTFLLSGCGPKELVIWSPDGSLGLVNGNSGTYLIDAHGNMLGNFPESEQWLTLPWLPDSRRLIVVRTAKATFEEYKALLGETRCAAAYESGEKLLKALQTHEGSFDDFPHETHNDSAETITALYGEDGFPGLFMAMGFMFDKYPQEVTRLAQKFGDNIQISEDGKPELPLPYEVYELVIRNAHPVGATSEKVLLRSADKISWVRSSPNGKHIVYAMKEPVRPALYVIPTNGGTPTHIDSGAMQADWTRDAKWLVYAKTRLPFRFLMNETQLGTVTRRAVFDENGNLTAELPGAEDVAGILYHPESRVATLPDGRILFASAELVLPAAADASSKPSLYALRIGDTITVESLVSPEVRKQLPNRPDLFAVSPDGKHVAMSSDDGGEVAVLSLETGKLSILQERVQAWSSEGQKRFGFVPTWRNATEICYVAPPNHSATSSRRSEVILHPLGGTPRPISKVWTDQMTDFLSTESK